MSVSTAVRMALAKGNKKQTELAEYLGIQRQPVNLKLAKERWTGAELAKVAELTGGKLAFVYPTFPLLRRMDGKYSIGACDNLTRTIYEDFWVFHYDGESP